MDRLTRWLIPVVMVLLLANVARRWPAQPPVTPAPPHAAIASQPSAPYTPPKQPPLSYPWQPQAEATIASRVAPPPGFQRVALSPGSFGEWLRFLPLLPGRGTVRLHDGRPKPNQRAHAAIVDIDCGARDLQQCADAVIRLRAEYLFGRGRDEEIRFDFTSGDPAPWTRYAAGERVRVRGNRVEWQRRAAPDRSHQSFRRYLDLVFTYAGTASLARQLPRADTITPGAVFVKGGFPGHAVLVVDCARGPRGKLVFLLVQSYMPAQQIHLLQLDGSPWHRLDGDRLRTAEWDFRRGHLRRF